MWLVMQEQTGCKMSLYLCLSFLVLEKLIRLIREAKSKEFPMLKSQFLERAVKFSLYS